MPQRGLFWKIFVSAAAIRWAYALLIYALMGEDGLIGGSDSTTYIANAQEFAEAIAAGSLHGSQWLGLHPFNMPLFAWLFALNALLFGSMGTLTYVLTQGLIDAATCLLIYKLAQGLNPRFALPAAIAAAINPTQIVLSGLAYSDTPFVFFVALFMLAFERWLRNPSWRWAGILGLGLGAAALVRIFVAPWIAASLLFLLVVCVITRRVSPRIAGQLLGAAAIGGLCVSLVAWRSHDQFGSWSLTPQSGMHMALWIIPLVKEAQDGTPWAQSYKEMMDRARARFGPVVDDWHSPWFEQSERFTEISREPLSELKLTSFVKAWALGAAINLGAPAVILSPPVSHLPRTGFFATAGNSLLDKVGNFLFRSDNAAYAWILLIGIAGLAVARLLQLIGLWTILKIPGALPLVALFGFWFVYVLAINGPIASPKYRLPLEPLLNVLSAAGFCALRDWRLARSRPQAIA
jgi:4-amino-4-deoxy-L-arabinose transferase-like glycosyltransferase